MSASVFSATTGKITGVLTDAENQQPLVGVTVTVQGTSMGAITDVDGRYTILNVPVGTYSVKFSAIGYQSVEVSQIDVHADLATYQNQMLSSSVTDLDKTINVVADNPMIIRDKTTAINIVKSEEIQALPTRGFEQVVGLQNSVVRMNINNDNAQRGGANQKGSGSSINLRGGRPSEVAYYVDGFSQQDPLTGLSTSNISNNAIQEVSIQSGAFSAEYGHVASGIVNVVTNSGSDEYHATAEVVTDNFASGAKKVYDHNYYTFDVNGPIPGLEDGYFALSGERRYLQDRTPSPITEEWFGKFGIPNADGNVLPNNALSGWSYQGKFNYNFSPNFKFTLSGNGSVDNWQDYQHFYNNPIYRDQIDHTPRYKDTNYGINAMITHTLNANNFYNLSVSFFNTERFRGDGVLFDNLAAYERVDVNGVTITNPEYDVNNLFVEGDTVMTINNITGDTTYSYQPHYYDDYLKRKSQYLGVKGDFTSQLNASNTVKVGFDFQRHTLRYYRDLIPTLKGSNPSEVNRYGYDSLGNESDNEGYKNATKHPINLGVYIQDRFDWGGLIVNAGLRFDYFDYKALRIRNFERPFDPDNIDASDVSVDESDLEASEKFTRLSPRLGISFPISDITQMHVNFGKFFQRPDLVNLYTGYDFLEERISAGSFFPFPSPNLEPEKITQYEIGFTHQLGEYSSVSFTAYYKDIQDLTQIVHQSPAFPTAYDFYGNVDYGTVKGLDVSFEMRRTQNMTFSMNYTLGLATGTGSYAGSTQNIAWKNSSGTPKTTSPLDYDQRHSISSVIDFRTLAGEGPEIGGYKIFENINANALIQLGSGTPYTPMKVYDAITSASVKQEPIGSINSANLPWQFQIDIKIQKTFKVSNYKIIPYVWVQNLLDRENVIAVYEGTGKADKTGFLETPAGQSVGGDFSERYSFLENNPKNYGTPRMIFAGLRVSF